MNKPTDPEADLSSSFHQLMKVLDQAFRSLGKSVSPLKVEALAGLVHHAMSQRGRRYHAMPHLFEIGENAGPIEALAIAFHDTVYVQVDRRVHPKLKRYVRDFPLERRPYHLVLPELSQVKSRELIEVAYEIFNVKPNQTLTPQSKENEFLSALVAARVLGNFLDPWEIIQVMACIEATVPFREVDAQGLTPAELLYQRIDHINLKFGFHKTKQEIEKVVKLSIKVSNRDLIGFASQDPGRFLSQTWGLLLEGNPIFRNPLYTAVEYRTAVLKIEGFFSFLKPSLVFRQYRDEPNSAQYKVLIDQAKLNLSIGVEYIQTKLVGMALHEALFYLSGGDGPLVIFRGDFPTENSFKCSLLDIYLDQNIPTSPDAANNPAILKLLKLGRAVPDGFDFVQSTLGAYLYERLDEKSLKAIIEKSKEFFKGKIPPLTFLELFPRPVLLAILKATKHIAWSRKKTILELIKKFS